MFCIKIVTFKNEVSLFFFYLNMLQVNLNQEDVNLLFRILAENLGEAPGDLNKVKPRIQETGKRLTVGGIIRVSIYFSVE